MKTAVFFLFTTFISIACLETALGAKHPLLLYAIGFGVWGLFIWHCNCRMKKKAAMRQRERQFLDFMRYQNRNFRR
jgi:hypothetical protein